jgi:hypothetical protein
MQILSIKKIGARAFYEQTDHKYCITVLPNQIHIFSREFA